MDFLKHSFGNFSGSNTGNKLIKTIIYLWHEQMWVVGFQAIVIIIIIIVVVIMMIVIMMIVIIILGTNP
jgi:uncharacterized paraquat-inducible protein A